MSDTGPFRLSRGGRLIDRAYQLPFRFDGRHLRGLEGDTLASALMALALWFIEGWLETAGVARIPGLAVLVIGGAAIYFALAFLTGAYKLSELKTAVRRRG